MALQSSVCGVEFSKASRAGFTSRGHGLVVLDQRPRAQRLIDEALQRGEGCC